MFTREETLDTVRTVTRELARVGLPVMPSLGNHDIIPKNQVKTTSQYSGAKRKIILKLFLCHDTTVILRYFSPNDKCRVVYVLVSDT